MTIARTSLWAATLIALLLSGPVRGQDAGGVTATLIAAELKSTGLAPSIDKDDQGDPRITVKVDGRTFEVYFYDCAPGENALRRCKELQLFTRFEPAKAITLAALNEWNNSQRHAKVYNHVFKNGSTATHMEIDIPIVGTGADPALLFRHNFALMKRRSDRFAQTVAK